MDEPVNSLDLCDVFFDDVGMRTVGQRVEFENVVHFNVVLYARE